MNPKKIYALLVGINDYKSESVPNLGGTHKDVADVQNYIESSYAGYEKEVVVLKDSEANRVNLIKHFEHHLAKAQEGDVALFYYSGHGSWGQTNEAFLKFDPDGRDEGLVCYDSRHGNTYDLADKELAVLLNHVASNNAEVILLIDSCHSGSMTRAANTRMTKGFEGKRNIEHYLHDATLPHLNLFYKKQLDTKGDVLEIPISRHLSMSACSERELARETEEGGWFTQSLLQVLRDAKEPLSYFQIYRSVYSLIAQKEEKQTPQLEGYGVFNANNTFITGEKNSNKEKRFQVTNVRGNDRAHRIDFGAQSGFPLNLGRAINFNIYESQDAEEPIGTGRVRSIGIVDSEIKLSLYDEPEGNTFWAEILDVAFTPLTICFEGDAEDLDRLNEVLKTRNIEQVLFVENDKVCPFVIAWQEKDQCYRLTERSRPIFILEMGKDDLTNDFKVKLLIETLEHLSQWYYAVNLDNPKSRIPKDEIEIKFTTWNAEDAEHVTCEYEEYGEFVEVSLDKGNDDPHKNYHKIIGNCSEIESIDYNVSMTNHSDERYFVACLLISADYGVIPLSSSLRIEPGETIKHLIDEDYCSLSIDREKDHDITNYIKILLSKKEITTVEGFQQNTLKLEEQLQYYKKVNKKNFGARKNINDWCTKTLALNLKQDRQQVNNEDFELYTDGIVIQGHENFSANIALSTPPKRTRSAEQMQFPRGGDLEVCFLAQKGTRSAAKNTVELTNIANEASLKENPLKISIPRDDEATVMPFTVETILVKQEDGSYKEERLVLPIGTYAGVDESGKDVFEIRNLPVTEANKGTRSLGKALKMFFAKVVLRRDMYKLCWVNYQVNGGKRVDSGVAEKVAAANKIMIVIHGILGDTEAMAQNMAFAQDYYDLILTYDYENLNTPIVDIAAEFKQKLTDAGIYEGCGKEVDIVAHSMGGLVSRTLIEKGNLKGDNFIRRLYMLGTPNGGSAIANITTYRNMAMMGMSLMLNLKTLGAPAILSKWLGGLKFSQKLTLTLEQMHKDSDFLKQLNNNPAPKKTQYYIISGDITNYETASGPLMTRLMDWASVQVGGLFYGNTPNDIAVATSSIQAVPEYFDGTKMETVDCHHMIYFVDEPSMTILKSWMAEE